MSYQIDHLFVLSRDHEDAARRLAAAGFSLASRRDHPGQGTANRCVHLENGYLEIMWVARKHETVSAVTRPTGIDERSRWSETSASPVGIALRGQDDSMRPFPCFAYRPAYLPGEAAILIADEPVAAGAPLVFVLPSELKSHGVALDHQNGARRITSLAVTATVDPAASPALAMLRQGGLCTVVVGKDPGLHVELDDGRQGQRLDLNPWTPLVVVW